MKSSYLSRFTPSSMSQETLEAIFVQRHWLANDLIEVIRESALTANKHFRLLVGMRGIGKTHLISLIYYRVSKIEELRDKLLIAWLPEDRTISSFLDLLLEIFKALQKEYPEEYNHKLEEQVKALYQLSEDEAKFTSEILLKEFVGQRTVLLLVENLDDLFDGLDDIGQKQLRAYIQNYSFLTILATAQSLFDGVKLYDYPFYGFFYPHYLEELKLDEAVDLLMQIARLENDRDLESFIRSPAGKDRIRAIHHLAGGNPRIYVIFSEFLSRKSLDELVTPFMRTLDELTPYYQARMAWLSREQRKIVEFLVERRYPTSEAEIVRYCFLNQQTASSQLKDLQEKGYLRWEKIGGICYYELREVLMRFCLEVKKQRGEPIRLFVNFLRIWYTQEELQQRWERCLASSQDSSSLQVISPKSSSRLEESYRHQQLSSLSLEQEYLRRALEAIDSEEDPRLVAYIEEFWVCDEKKDFLQGLRLIEKLVEIRGEAFDWFQQGYCLAQLERYEEAIASYDRALNIKSDYYKAWNDRGIALGKLGRLEEAIASYDRAFAIKTDHWKSWFNRGNALAKLGKLEEAIAAYDRVLFINPDEHEAKQQAWFRRGNVLLEFGRLQEAIASFDRALNIKSDDHGAWHNRGIILFKLGRLEEALTSYDLTLIIKPDHHETWYSRGNALFNLGRLEEALASYNRALAIKPDQDNAWYNQGNTLRILSRLEEAIAAYDRALDINPDDHYAWNNRGVALDNLGRLEEAIAAYDRALAIKPNKEEAWYNRGWVFLKLGRFEEATACFDRAIELGYNYSGVFFNRAIAILGFDRWDEGITALENTIKQIQNKDEIAIDDTELIIRILFKNTQDAVVWKSRLTRLIQLCDQYKILSQLGQGLVKSIPALMPETVRDNTARTWLELWQELAKNYPEFQIPLRLLNIAVRYKETKGDRRVLLELAIEERLLLEPLLGAIEPINMKVK